MTFKPFGGSTIECRACHEQVSTDATECPNCGENLTSFKLFGSTITCRACHEKVSTDASECPHCGENLYTLKVFGSTTECRACHERVSTDATECPHCGENLTPFKVFAGTIECRACHEQVSTDATECPNCGENLKPFKLYGSTIECRACHRQVSTDTIECPHCGEDLDKSFFSSFKSARQTSTVNQSSYFQKSQSSVADGHRSDTDEQTDSSSWIIKWLFYAALFIGAIWLAFAVVLPLIIIDCAMISLLVGLIYKKGKQYWLILSIIGTLFVFLDYNNGWVTKKLVENVAFFSNTMPFLVYLNLVAGLISSYFLVTALLKVRVRSVNYDRNSSRNNLIIVGGLAAIGASVFLIQSHINLNRSFDSANLVYNSGQTSQSQQTVADPTIVTLPSQSTSSTAGAGNTTVKNGEFVGQFFEVKIPNGFTVRPSLEGVKGRGGYGEYQSVFAQSPDNQVEFYMFGGFLDDMATDVAIDPNREKRVSSSTQKSKSGVTTTWTELKALNNSYFKAYQDTKNPAGNEHWVVGLRYNTQAAYNLYKQQYLAFKKSYTELGGD